jgi:REP element-mobilizing transposase RayT
LKSFAGSRRDEPAAGEFHVSHTYIWCRTHLIYSTKDRRRQIAPDLQSRLWPYLGGIARENGLHAMAVGGGEDHVHMLLGLCATLSLSSSLQRIKGASSRWVHENFPDLGCFAWQEGYGAFSVSQSQVGRTIRYIQGQEEHHRRTSFEEEFVAFLRRYGMPYDPQRVFG